MKISTKGRYALRMMIDLAVYSEDGPVALKDISKRQEISAKYLEQIAALLTKARYVTSIRGAQGGYILGKTPEEYTVGDILRTTEGSLAPVACLEGRTVRCTRCHSCPTLGFWRGLYQTVEAYVDSVTLRQLAEEQKQLGRGAHVI